MDAIVHFGMFKTGSTSIQNTLFKLMQGPLKDEFMYLAPDGLPSSDRIIKILHRRNHGGRAGGEMFGIKPENLAAEQDKLRAAIVEQIGTAKGRKLFFSSESLPIVDKTELGELRGFFAAAGYQPKAVGYIRPPKSLIDSDFQQRVKTGTKNLEVRALFPKYRQLFEKFDPIFGRENVSYWVFDPKTFVHGDVVRDFASHIGIDVDAKDVWRENDALSLPALSLLFAYRKYGAPYEGGRTNTRLIKKLQSLPGGKVRLHSSLLAPVFDEFGRELAWMEGRLGVSLTEKLDADDAIAIKTEEDLLSFTPQSLRWLSEQIEDHPASQKVLSGDPNDVARGVHALYEKQS